MKEKNLRTNFIWNSIGSFTYLFCQWLLTLIIIRVTNNLVYAGIFSLSISVSNIFATISNFNVRPFLVSDLNNDYSVNDYSCFRIITATASFVFCIIYSLFFNYSKEQFLCIIFYMIFKIGESLVELFHSFEQRKSRMDIGGISLFIRGILSVLSFTIGLAIFNNLLVAIVLMTIVTYIFIFTYDYLNVLKFEKISLNFKNTNIKKLFIILLPLTIGSFLGIFCTSFPRQVLEKISGADVLGIYATIATPAVIVQVAATYIYNPLLVEFATLKNNKNKKSFINLFIKGILMIIVTSIFCFIGSVLLSEKVLYILYGNEISSYYKLFNLIIIYTSLTGIMWYFYNILIIFRKIKEILILNIISFIVCLLLSKIFIINFGMNGVTYILSIITLIVILGMLYFIMKSINRLNMKEE